MHSVHYSALFLSLGLGGLGILFAFMIYEWKKIDPDKLAGNLKPLYNLSYNKWYIDEIYDKTFIAGTLLLSRALAWFDTFIVDGIVNGSAFLTRMFSIFIGGFDKYVIDGFVNLTAFFSGFIGLSFRKLQTGKVQTYIVLAIVSVVILLVIFRPF
jgi:NADH-quinone oxidoreductase subunit L